MIPRIDIRATLIEDINAKQCEDKNIYELKWKTLSSKTKDATSNWGVCSGLNEVFLFLE